MKAIQKKLNYGVYAVLTFSAAAMGILKYAVFAKILMPEDFAIYSLILSSYIFVLYLGGMGMCEGFLKLGSLAHGSDSFNDALRFLEASLVYGSGIFFIIICVFSLGYASVRTIYGWPLLFFYLPFLAYSAFIHNVLFALFRVQQSFICFSLMLFLKSFIMLGPGFFIGREYGAGGLLALETISFLVVFSVFWGRKKGVVSLVANFPNKALFKQLLKHGLPILLSSAVRNILIVVERWFVALALGLFILGQYSFLMTVYLVAITLIGFICNILGPKWLSDYARDLNFDDLFKRVLKVVLCLFIVFFILGGCLLLAMPLIIGNFYAQYYSPSLYGAAYMIFLGTFIGSLVCVFDWLFIATSKERVLLKNNVLVVVFAVLLLFHGYLSEYGLSDFAMIFLINRSFTLIIYGVEIFKLRAMQLEVSIC